MNEVLTSPSHLAASVSKHFDRIAVSPLAAARALVAIIVYYYWKRRYWLTLDELGSRV